jgi:hypothetical protein
MGYNLGDVKPWVKAAAEVLGKQFGIKTIGGWRSQGSVPGSLHPKGLALDLMTTKGQALADYAKANAAAFGITEVIWNRKIWTARRSKEGWRSYSGPSPHTDHVHLSFGNSAPNGKLPEGKDDNGWIPGIADPGDITGAINNVGNAIKEIGTTAASGAKLADQLLKLALPTNIVRAAVGGLGLAFLFLGIFFLMREATK